MPTQLQFDGPNLERLLARVRDELGSTARIVSAEKVRTGGLAGFFARERFEICVETDDGDGAPATPALPPTSLLELAEAVSDQERRSVSTETTTFGDVLRRLTQDGEGAPRMPLADLPLQRGPAQAWPRPPVVTLPSVTPPVVTLPVMAVPVLTAPAATRPTVLPPPIVTESTPAGPPEQALPAPGPFHPEVLVEVLLAEAREEPSTPGPVSHAVVVREPARPADPQRECPEARPALGLSLLGLPAHLMPGDCSDGLRAALVASLTRLPEADEIVNAPGQVLAVIGPAALALAVGRQIAAELDLDPDKTLLFAGTRPPGLAADRVLASPSAAAQRRAAWRRRRTLGILAIDAPVTAAGAIRAAEYLDALPPTVVWGAVEASRKPADIGRWAEFLGGIDALALQEVESTGDPATALSLGIPVSRLGHHAASAESWAALLTARLAG